MLYSKLLNGWTLAKRFVKDFLEHNQLLTVDCFLAFRRAGKNRKATAAGATSRANHLRHFRYHGSPYCRLSVNHRVPQGSTQEGRAPARGPSLFRFYL